MSEGVSPHAVEAPPGSATLILVRHGESIWNAAGVLQGQQCNGLSPTGLQQADAIAEHLVKHYSDARLLVRSDIQRVQQTSAPTEERLGLAASLDVRLREVDLGSWSGRSREEVLATDAADLHAWMRCEDVRGGGGETLSELRARVWTAMGDIAQGVMAEGGGTALVFTHGGPIRTSTAAVLGLGIGGERNVQPVRNGALTVVRLDPDGIWRLVGYNRADHLV